MKVCISLALFFLLLGAQELMSQEGRSQKEIKGIPISDKVIDPITNWDCFVYPVPAVDELSVKITRGQVNIREVRVTDDSGTDVYQSDELSDQKIKVDISGLNNGRYYLVIFPDDDLPVVMKRFYVSK